MSAYPKQKGTTEDSFQMGKNGPLWQRILGSARARLPDLLRWLPGGVASEGHIMTNAVGDSLVKKVNLNATTNPSPADDESQGYGINSFWFNQSENRAFVCISTDSFKVTDIDTTGESGSTLDGEYFILYDSAGSVAFWYDVDNSGTLEPAHGANRSVEISTVIAADGPDEIASKTQAAIDADSKFRAIADAGLSVVEVINTEKGNHGTCSAGTTGFSVVVVQSGSGAVWRIIGENDSETGQRSGFDQSFFTSSAPYIETASATPVVVANYIFPGTDISFPQFYRVIASRNGTSGVSTADIFDSDGGNLIASVSFSGSTRAIYETISLSNLPVLPAQFEFRIATTGSKTRLHFVSFR